MEAEENLSHKQLYYLSETLCLTLKEILWHFRYGVILKVGFFSLFTT